MTSKIEWLRSADGKPGYTINPIKGLCPQACTYCYARRMYKRFKWDPEIRYDDWVWQVGPPIPKGSKIFVGSTIDLFGPWVKKEWLQLIFDYCSSMPSRTFIFLTKQPQNLAKWSPFPDNCWVGVSVCHDKMLDVAVNELEDIQAKVKFISFEPLLERLNLSLDYVFYYSGISWVIIGRQTPASAKTAPKVEWIKEIVEAADEAKIPVFLKNNLYPVLVPDGHYEKPFYMTVPGYGAVLRQEFPILHRQS